MPELPEVETIVRELNRKIVGRKILDAWTDWPKTIKTHTLKNFISDIACRKVLGARRRAKYIIMDLSGGKSLIIHQKISGHLLYGKWEQTSQKPKIKSQNLNSKGKSLEQRWVSAIPGPLRDDPFNRFIRFILFLDNGWQIGLSDLRRFGKIYLCDTGKIESISEIGKLGPEPLDSKFTFAKFRESISRKRGVIKKVLTDPFIISGIGNIYSDEILWHSGIHPLRTAETLKGLEIRKIYKYVKFVLKKAIAAKGDSQQDYRTLEGKFGNYQNMTRAYQMTGRKCQKNDGGIIKRIKINGRSAHYCPEHQK